MPDEVKQQEEQTKEEPKTEVNTEQEKANALREIKMEQQEQNLKEFEEHAKKVLGTEEQPQTEPPPETTETPQKSTEIPKEEAPDDLDSKLASIEERLSQKVDMLSQGFKNSIETALAQVKVNPEQVKEKFGNYEDFREQFEEDPLAVIEKIAEKKATELTTKQQKEIEAKANRDKNLAQQKQHWDNLAYKQYPEATKWDTNNIETINSPLFKEFQKVSKAIEKQIPGFSTTPIGPYFLINTAYANLVQKDKAEKPSKGQELLRKAIVSESTIEGSKSGSVGNVDESYTPLQKRLSKLWNVPLSTIDEFKKVNES